MAKSKNIKNKNKMVENYRSDEQREIIRFGVILLVIVGVVVIIYFISDKFRSKNVYNFDNITEGAVSYDVVSVGTMLNRPYEEYYVAIYNGEDSEAIYYSTIISEYTSNEDSLKVYYCDLNNKLNENYKAEEGKSTNPSAETINELSLGKFTFIKVKNGKIVKYYESAEDMKTELNVEK